MYIREVNPSHTAHRLDDGYYDRPAAAIYSHRVLSDFAERLQFHAESLELVVSSHPRYYWPQLQITVKMTFKKLNCVSRSRLDVNQLPRRAYLLIYRSAVSRSSAIHLTRLHQLMTG